MMMVIHANERRDPLDTPTLHDTPCLTCASKQVPTLVRRSLANKYFMTLLGNSKSMLASSVNVIPI